MKKLIFLFLISLAIISCNKNAKDFDENGNLNAVKLHAASGGVDFKPMQNTDSADLANYKPVVYNYDEAPYSGKIAAYDEKDRLMMTGNLTAGIADGAFIFYYPSGVVQVQGKYKNGYEDGMWYSYYGKDKPRIVMFYDNGLMLMRKEYYDTGKIKNYQNINSPKFGNIERRIQFKYNGDIEYIDAEREVGKLTPKEINELLKNDGLMR
ncbi:MAG: toxin-antitoxin system YwqK family antitoxin [Chitinophagales bacterium]